MNVFVVESQGTTIALYHCREAALECAGDAATSEAKSKTFEDCWNQFEIAVEDDSRILRDAVEVNVLYGDDVVGSAVVVERTVN